MAKKNYDELAKAILANIGGTENVSFSTHCMTRLRFNLHDKSLGNLEKINELDGVIGSQWSGEQLQIIIGPAVKDVYAAVTKAGNFNTDTADSKKAGETSEKLTLKKIGNNILNYVSASVAACIPVLVASGMAMTINVLCGPTILNLYSDTSEIYKLINFLYEGCFYFLPVLLGYGAAKKLKLDPLYGIYMGTVLITPSLISIVTEGAEFKVFGISMPLVNYAQSLLPVLLCVWVLSIVYKYIAKIVPEVLASVLVPMLTMLITLPLALFIFAPMGSVLSTYVAAALTWFGNTFGFLSTAVISGLWILLVTTGMHGAVYFANLPIFLEKGMEYNVMPAMWTFTCATWGICIAAIIMMKNKKDKSLAIGYFATNILGGVTEPTIFGLILRYKRLLACQILGGFAGGLYLGLTHTAAYAMMGSSNFSYVLTFVAGGTSNIVNGVIGGLISVAVAAAAGCLWGLRKENLS